MWGGRCAPGDDNRILDEGLRFLWPLVVVRQRNLAIDDKDNVVPFPTGKEEPLDIGSLFDDHGAYLCRVVHRLTGSREAAEDIVQEVFLLAHHRRNELEDRVGIRTWLYRVAVNHVRHRRRSFARYQGLLDRYQEQRIEPRGVARPDDAAVEVERGKLIQTCVAKLSDKQREVFVLYELEELEGAQIAEDPRHSSQHRVEPLAVGASGVSTRMVQTRTRGRCTMNQAPRRLMDDPDFKWETGCDLKDEASVVGDYDLAGVKDALLQNIAAGVPPAAVGGSTSAAGGIAGAASVIKPLLGVLAATTVVGGAYLLGVQNGAMSSLQPVMEAPAPIEVAATYDAPNPSELTADDVEAFMGEAGVGDDDGPAWEYRPEGLRRTRPRKAPKGGGTSARRQAKRPAAAASADAAEVMSKPPPIRVPPAGEADRAAPRAPQSSMPQQLALYDAADYAFEDGDYEAALTGYEAYLEAYPTGQFREAAEQGMLHALFEAGDAQGTAELAAVLQDRIEHASNRQEICRLHAESLVLLDRCRDALALADDLTSKDAARIRRACRLKRSSKQR